MVLSASKPDDDSADRLLAAASQLFYERGIQAVGMDAIRDASGVSLKRIYRLFPTKEALVEATLASRERTVLRELEQIAARTGDKPRARILAIFDLLADWFSGDDYRGCEFINAFGELGPSSQRIATVARQHKAAWRDVLGRLVADAGASPALADQLALLVNGAMVTAALRTTDDPAADAKAAATTLVDAALGDQTARTAGAASS